MSSRMYPLADVKTHAQRSESLTEKIETASSTGKLIFQVFASLAEFERNLICERTMAGFRAARARPGCAV
jgi:DNA invertase Pin-like site-specific DNA recombinase